MKLAQIKTQLGIPQLELNTANDLEGKPTDWLRHWDNENRKAVSIHKDLFKELSEDKDQSITSLALQHEVRAGEKGDYDSYRIVKYAPAEFTL